MISAASTGPITPDRLHRQLRLLRGRRGRGCRSGGAAEGRADHRDREQEPERERAVPRFVPSRHVDPFSGGKAPAGRGLDPTTAARVRSNPPARRANPRRCVGYHGRLDGAVAEWLGRGLQSLVQRFDSARRLFFPKLRRFSRSHSSRHPTLRRAAMSLDAVAEPRSGGHRVGDDAGRRSPPRSRRATQPTSPAVDAIAPRLGVWSGLPAMSRMPTRLDSSGMRELRRRSTSTLRHPRSRRR